MAEPTRTHVVLDGTAPAEDDAAWWTKKDAEIGPAMVRMARIYEDGLQDRREKSRGYVQRHKGSLLTFSMLDAAFARAGNDDPKISWNIVQAAANTAMSIVTRNRVRVTFETTGTDQELQDAAKLAELLVQGVFAGNKMYEELDQLWFLDAAVPGLGAILTEPDNFGNIILRRIIPDALIYNEAGALNRKPREFMIVDWMSKWDAIQQHATTVTKKKDAKKGDAEQWTVTVDEAKRDAINAAPAFQLALPNNPDKHIPLVPIYTAWYLPSFREATDGKRVVAVPGNTGNPTLSTRQWKWPRLPLSFLRLENNPAGLWGIGMAERLEGCQDRLNELNWDISEAARHGSVGKWLVDSGSNVNPDDLTNEHASIATYTSKEPKWVNNDGIPRDLVVERDTEYKQGLRDVGLSEWTTGGTQPANIESGEGLRQLREQEQGRAIPAGQNWEGGHVDVSECIVLAGLDAHDEHPDMTVQVIDPDGNGLQKVAFKDVAKLLQDPDAWQVRPYPTSILPSTPTGKFEKLREWRQDGTIDQATFEALSDMPDLQRESSLILAGIKAVRFFVGKIVKSGVTGYEPPDPALPLELAIKIAHSTYLKGLRTGLSEDKLELLLAWMDDCKALLQGPPPAAATPATGTPAAGGDMGTPSPEAQAEVDALTPGSQPIAATPPEVVPPMASAPGLAMPSEALGTEAAGPVTAGPA